MKDNCIFCEIIKKSTKTDLVYENSLVVVINDINPQAPVHLLILPKKHIRSINSLSYNNDSDILLTMLIVGKEMAKFKNIDKFGYKLLFNVEKGGGQVIFHLHLHLIGGWK